ncbi:TIR domain-containing protein, partial [Pyxidicoccus fallax]
MFDVFLSHNSQDKPAVEALAQRLRSEAKLQPFLDRWQLVPGETWQSKLEKGLKESLSVAVFFGPHGLSPWHDEEMRLALSQAVMTRDEYRIIPVLLPGARSEDVKGFLAQRTWVDFRDGLDDPVAFTRLVAGIQGQAPEGDTYQLPDEPAPYRGLLPFTGAQTRFFFGREADIPRVLERLARHPFVAVVGASGVGKSSLVLGGVLPRLKPLESWPGPALHLRTMRPGDRPLRALADQLATLVPPGERLATAEALVQRMSQHEDGLRTAVATLTAAQPGSFVLVVDQLEELFAYGPAGDSSPEAGAFMANLRDAVERSRGAVRILTTLRADFFERCLGLSALRELLQEGQVLLGSMSTEALRDAIVRPAQLVGAFLEKGLVGTILKDVSREPGALPLLEHALYELWRARKGAWLTLQGYEASGGVSGALQRRAQSTYEGLPPDGQRLACQLLLRLMSLGEGTPDTKRRVARSELVFPGVAPEQLEHVLQVLSGPEARLLVVDKETVEVAHEVLIHEWRTLRDWVDANRRSLQVHRRLTEAANEWADHGRDASYLYTGARLLEAEECLAPKEPRGVSSLNQRERDFVMASLARYDEEKREQQRRHMEELAHARQLTRVQRERAEAARRAARRLRVLALVLIVATSAILGSLFAVRHQRRTAHSRELTASALLKLTEDPQLSLRLIQEAGHIAMTRQVGEALYAWSREPSWMVLRARAGAVNAASISSDGGKVVTASDDGTVRLWDLRTGQSRHLTGHQAPVEAAEFSPDGTKVVTASDDGTARLWDLRTGQSLVLPGAEEPVLSATFNPDGTQVVTAGNAGTVRLWDVASNRFRLLTGHEGPVLSARFSPNGTRLATTGFDGTVRLWDVASGRSQVLSGHEGAVWSARFSPEGTRLISAGVDGTARLWDVVSGRASTVLTGHTAPVWSARFSPDGTRAVTASEDGSTRVWDVAAGRASAVFVGHSGTVWSAQFNPEGTKVVTAGGDGTARLWDVASGKATLLLSGHTAPVLSACFSPDGTKVVTASLDGTARLWDVAFTKASTILSGHEGAVLAAGFSPDGGHAVTVSDDGTARLWETASGTPFGILSGHEGTVLSARFSPDGTKVVTAGNDGTARLWEVASPMPPTTLAGHEGAVLSARFSPDGTKVVTAGRDGTARLWDVASGQSRVLSGHEGPVRFAEVSVDGGTVVTASDDGTARLWDVGSGQSRVLAGHRRYRWPDPVSVGSAHFSPDGTKVVTAANDGTVRVWEVASGAPTAFFSLDTAQAWSAEFSPDGTKVVTAGDDGTVRLWDVARGTARKFSGHTGPVRTARFSADGTKVVTAGDDGTARLWDVARDTVRTFSGHTGPVRAAEFSADGRMVVTASDDGTAR